MQITAIFIPQDKFLIFFSLNNRLVMWTVNTSLLLQLTCCHRRHSWAARRCCLVELLLHLRRVSDQSVTPSRRRRTVQQYLVRRLLTAQRWLVEGTVQPGRGPGSRQDRAEFASRPWNNSVGRQAPWTGRPCCGRPPTEIEQTRSAELLAGTSDDLSIK